MNQYMYSAAIYVDKEETLEKCLASFCVSGMDPVQIIVADPEGSEAVKKCCEEAKRAGIDVTLVVVDGCEVGEAYNRISGQLTGKYVNFNLSSNYLQHDALRVVDQNLQAKPETTALSLAAWTLNEVGELKPYVMNPSGEWNVNNVLELDEEGVMIEPEPLDEAFQIWLNPNPAKLALMLAGYFIHKDTISNHSSGKWFQEGIHQDALFEFLIRYFDKNRKYLYLPGTYLYYSVPMEDNFGAYGEQHQKYWYTDAIRKWMLPLAKASAVGRWPIPGYMRVAFLYLTQARYNCNLNDRNKGILNAEEVEELGKAAGELMCYLGTNQIIHPHDESSFSIAVQIRMLLIQLRNKANKSEYEIMLDGSNISYWESSKDNTRMGMRLLNWEYRKNMMSELRKGKKLEYSVNLFTVNHEAGSMPEMERIVSGNSVISLCNLNQQTAAIHVVNFENGCLEIDGLMTAGYFADNEMMKVVVRKIVEDKAGVMEYEAVRSECYALTKVFGKAFWKAYKFHVSVPVESEDENFSFQFYLDINGRRFVQKLRSASVYAHFNPNLKHLYWNFRGSQYMVLNNSTTLQVLPLTEEECDAREALVQDVLSNASEKGNELAAQALRVRRRYKEMRPQLEGRRIWMSFDKLYKAGDNGEYIYHYVHDNSDEIDMYYIANSTSDDYVRLKEAGENVLAWADEETMVMSLYAECILATHENLFRYIGFETNMQRYICDLFDPFNVCIQHGLTTQSIAQHQNRWIDNLKLYTCASPNEVENLSHPVYGFEDKSALLLTGVGRYDGLKNNDQRQILITPTWRKELANSGKMGSSRSYNEFFKESEYYRLYNGLISDPELIRTAAETGYRIIYLLHPVLSVQLDDFEQREGVEIIPAAGDMSYEKILTESSLMVTDYSGVQFDFAYQRKPVLYYHPKSLPGHYEESKAYQYKTMAFGPLIDNHEELVRQLCEYMRNNCQMIPEYVERANRFFAHDDFDSCKRIYEEIRKRLG